MFFKKFYCRIRFFFSAIFAIVVLNSCLISTEPYRPTRTFDFGSVSLTNLALRVEKIENPQMYRYAFVYRLGENEIDRDEFNKWAALPENLLLSTLKSTFIERPNAPVLSAKILKLEFDTSKRLAILSIAYSISRNGQSLGEDFFLSDTQFKELDGAAMANAMSTNIAKFIAKICEKIKE